jgi:uncharacterized protein
MTAGPPPPADPGAAPARQSIERYGASGFRISGAIYEGPVLVFPERTVAWTLSGTAITPESLAPVIAHGEIEILLLGQGSRMRPLSPALRDALKAAGIAVEPMDTGAACRTYNILVAEDRRVAAALLPPV